MLILVSRVILLSLSLLNISEETVTLNFQTLGCQGGEQGSMMRAPCHSVTSTTVMMSDIFAHPLDLTLYNAKNTERIV